MAEDKNSIYFYSPSYQTLLFAVRNFRLNSIVIVTSNLQIKQFCDKCSITYFYFNQNSDTSLSGLFKYKKKMLTIAEEFQNKEFFFCFFSFDLFGLFLVERLDDQNKIYFENQDDVPQMKIDWLSIKTFLNPYLRRKGLHLFTHLIVLRKLFGLFKKNEDEFYLGISPAKLRKKYRKFDHNNSQCLHFRENSINILSQFGVKKYDILFIDDGLKGKAYETKMINTLFRSFQKRGYSVAIKQRPDSNDTQEQPGITILPREIPAEILMNQAEVAIIGVTSATFKSTDSDLIKISLLEMVDWSSEDRKQWAIEFIGGFKNLHFPKSESELLNLLL